MKHPPPSERPTPVEVYLFTMPGCGYCEETKAKVLPLVQRAGAFVVVLEAALAVHSRCGVTPKAYPTWLFSVGGKPAGTLVGLRKPKEIIQTWQKLREA